MFIGHFGLGFAAKKATPSVSLGTLFIAAQFLDLLWPTLLLVGIEKAEIVPGITKLTPLDFTYYPFTHSLSIVLVWGILFAAVSWFISKNRKQSLILGLLVCSHWFLDLLVHRPDLQLYPGQMEKCGFGLWNYPVAAVSIEILLFILGLKFYLDKTISKNKLGSLGFWFLAIFLFVIYLANIFGPPPPDIKAVAIAGHLQWLFVLLAFWVDKNRTTKHY